MTLAELMEQLDGLDGGAEVWFGAAQSGTVPVAEVDSSDGDRVVLYGPDS